MGALVAERTIADTGRFSTQDFSFHAHMSQYLISERPLIIQPTMVEVFGFEDSAILQQIFFLQNSPHSGADLDKDGLRWVWNTYDEWCADFFPFWKPDTLQRRISALEKRGLIVSRQPKKKDWNRTKYYRVDDKAVQAAVEKYLEDNPRSFPDDHAPSIPDDRPGSIPDDNPGSLNTDNHTDSHTDKSSSSKKTSSASKKKQAAVDPRKDHPALKAVREVTARWPTKDIWDLLIKKIGESPDIERLRDCYSRWRAKGWSPINYGWATEWYADETTSSPRPREQVAEPDLKQRLDFTMMIRLQRNHPDEVFHDRSLYEQAKAEWLAYYEKRDVNDYRQCLLEVAAYESSEAFLRRFPQ